MTSSTAAQQGASSASRSEILPQELSPVASPTAAVPARETSSTAVSALDDGGLSSSCATTEGRAGGGGVQPTPSAASPLAGTAASSTVTHSPKAGAAGSAAAAPQSRPAVLAMTAQDVATAVGRIGRPYTAYEQSLVDNGIDGIMVAYLVSNPKAEALQFLERLGLSSFHSIRVFIMFQSLSQQ
jgi:hypothetical protein